MDALEILKLLAALLNIGFGVYVVLQPDVIAKYSHFSLDDDRGQVEMRVAMGGFFIGMGMGALLLGSLLNQPDESYNNLAYQVVGFAWFGGALTRLLNLVIEDRNKIVDSSFWLLLSSELIPGIILLFPV